MEFFYHDVDRDVLVLKADGGIDSMNGEDVTTELTRLVESGPRKLVIDCSRLGYISSAGVAVLLRLHKRLWAVGGDVKVAAAPGPVFRLLELTKLAELFEIYPSVAEALGAFRQST